MLSAALVLSAAVPAGAAERLLPGGDFEGPIADFGTGHGLNGGIGTKYQEGTCWSDNTSWGVTFDGDDAGAVRSLDHPTSIGMLTSDAFTAGQAVRFDLLSETSETDSGPAPADPSFFTVKILDASDRFLAQRQISDENIIELEHRDVPCEVGVGDSRDMAFSRHSIDTSSFDGQSIKVRFEQNTSVVVGFGFATLIDNVTIVDVDATASISPGTFYPVVDGYRDELVVEGTRSAAVSVDIAIRSVAGGAIVRTANIASAQGPYRWAWDGHGTNGASRPAALLSAGQYDVEVLLTDGAADTKTEERRITLSRDFIEWQRVTKTLNGRAISLAGRTKNGVISIPASRFPKGIFLNSKKGSAGVVYVFKVPKAKLYGGLKVKVRGRSRNGHKAWLAIWNPDLGGFRDLASYDAAKRIGSRLKLWTTKAPGQGRVVDRRLRTTLFVWKGLGGKGKSTFDIDRVKISLRVGKLESAGGASVANASVKRVAASLATKGAVGRTLAESANGRMGKVTRAAAEAVIAAAAAAESADEAAPPEASADDESLPIDDDQLTSWLEASPTTEPDEEQPRT